MHEEKDLKAIQDKLYNFEMDLPANDWEKLAVHIPTAKKARLFPLWAQRAAAVAVIALLAGGG